MCEKGIFKLEVKSDDEDEKTDRDFQKSVSSVQSQDGTA